MIRRWTAWRLAISAFVLFHVAATVIWVTPVSPLKQRLMPPLRYYMLPLGLWQAWCMFAPDPQRETIVLESEVIDVHGMRHVYEFPKVADLPWWRKMPRFRHPKFASNLLFDEFQIQREFTARHAVRVFQETDHRLSATARRLSKEERRRMATAIVKEKGLLPKGRPKSE